MAVGTSSNVQLPTSTLELLLLGVCFLENRRKRAPGILHRQIADTEMPHAERAHGFQCARADVNRAQPGAEFLDKTFDWNGHEAVQRCQRLRARAAIVKDAEHPRQRHVSALDLVDEALHRLEIEMADDLSEIELGTEARVEQEIDLLTR